MPHKSEQEQLTESIALAYAVDMLVELEVMLDAEMDSSSSSSPLSSNLDNSNPDSTPIHLYILHKLAVSCYLHACKRNIEKTLDNLQLLFDVYKNEQPILFKAYMCVFSACLDTLLDAIQDHTIFHNKLHRNQMPVQQHAACA
jgi:hypothetical protein